MTTSRICATTFLIVAIASATNASADPGGGSVAVLDTFSKVWIKGDALGPTEGLVPKIGKNTGAGIMDAAFTFDRNAVKTNPNEVLLASAYTRSALQPNNAKSYMQGGFALAKLTAKGVELGPGIDLPELEGERAFMRPLIGFTSKYVVVIAASEDNGVNANPKPVMFLADKKTGALVPIPNSTRIEGPTKPTNLIVQATADLGENAVADPGGQRSPHMIVPVGDDSFVVGMQYNNRAAEAFRVHVDPSGAVRVSWLTRYSDNARHCRPQIAVGSNAAEGFITSVEGDLQPSEIGIRLTKFNVANGTALVSKLVVRSEPAAGKFVAEPSIGLVGGKVALGYGMGTPARQKGAGNANGHAGGSHVAMLALFDGTDLGQVGETLANAAPYGRHAHIFATEFGMKGEPAIAYIGGSSTGTKGGFEQILTLDAAGSLAAKNTDKLFPVSAYSDVGNVQTRGKRNPQDQGKGFINGLGPVPNPGFGKGATGFMSDVKSFSFSTITGYTDDAGANTGRRNSLWLSLVPAAWQEGLKAVPGSPTDKPGANANGTGPAARVEADPSKAEESGGRARPASDATDGCAIGGAPGLGASADAALVVLVAGLLIVLRRRSRRSWSFGIAIAIAGVGCSNEASDRLVGEAPPPSTTTDELTGAPAPGLRPSGGAEPGKLPTASKSGEAFFAAELHESLKSTCSTCHAAGGIGTPTWLDRNDPKKTYDMIYLQGFAVGDSRIVQKGAHSGGAAPALSIEQKTKWASWIALEAKEPMKPAQANVLAKLGDCFDKAKFDAIDLGQLSVIARNPANNPQGIAEDQDTCTGCRDGTRCSACHAADDVTGFVMAIGNNVMPADYTFQATKKMSPPFIRQYFGTTPAGEPTYNPGIKTKSVHTIEKGTANGHPMFQVTPVMEKAIRAFVEDAIAKQRAGACGKAP